MNDGVWFRFEGQIDLATQGEYGGIRHSYRAGIGEVLKNLKKAQVINFDLGIGDHGVVGSAGNAPVALSGLLFHNTIRQPGHVTVLPAVFCHF